MLSYAGPILNEMISRPAVELTNMNALVTGVKGFLGLRLAKHLLQAGARVIGLDVGASSEHFMKGVQYHEVNICNFDELQRVLDDLHVEDGTVFHLAGQPHVSKSRIDPLSTLSVNVMGTAHILEACRRTHVRKIVFPSTMLVYLKPHKLPIMETDPVKAFSVYASTKLAGEALLSGYASDFGLSCRIARLGTVFGPNASPDSVVGRILGQVKRREGISVRSLLPVRDFIYVDDAISGLIALATHPFESGCEVFNLATGIPTSIRELAEAACRAGKLEPNIVETGSSLADSDDKIVLSIQRIKELTRWRPMWTLERGLSHTLSEMD